MLYYSYNLAKIDIARRKIMFGRKNKNRISKSKNPDSRRFKLDMAAHLNGMALKCVTEKINGIEEVIGKSGSITVRDGELIIYSSMNVLFRCKVLDMKAWELMSLDGVVITAPDLENSLEERTVVAHYTYWRNVNA